MIIKLVEIYKNSSYEQQRYSLREIFLNSEHIVCLRPEPRYEKMLKEGYLPEGIDSRQEFTRVFMDRGHLGMDIVVVGSPEIVEKKVHSNKRKILKG